MATTPWFRQPRDVQQRTQDEILRTWLRREVIPFSSWWRGRIGMLEVHDAAGLAALPVTTEADAAGAGGPGNPGLLLSPTEDQFKRHAPRRELLAAARQLTGGGVAGRRQAIWHRYKTVHVHEAGVDRLLAIAYTRADLDRLHLAGARFAEVLGWGAEDALLNLVPSGPSVSFWGLYHAALASRMTALHPRGAGQAVMGAARRGLALLPASVITVPVEEAEAVLDGLVSAGSAAPNLRMVVPVGSPPSAATRVRLADLGDRLAGRPVAVQAAWAPEASRLLYGESPPAANDPPEATYGLLTQPDMEVLEVRDPGTGATVTDGGPGELVITTLGWRGTALVRFATGAWVGGLEGRVNHPVTGATVPRLAPAAVAGAWQPSVRVDGATRRPDLRGAGRLVEPVAAALGVRTWSLTVEDGWLVLAIDLPGVTAGPRGQVALAEPVRRPLEDLLDALGRGCGIRPHLRLDAALAARRPQVGDAGT